MSPKSSPFSRTPLRFRHGLQEVSYPTNGVLARLILRSLFDQEQYSDIIIQFEGLDDRFDWIRREVKCHKVILCHASKFFNAMCGPAKKSNETERNIIILEDDEQAGRVNEAVLRHIYNFTYAEIREIRSKASSTTARQMDVIVAGRKYLLPKLEQEALTALYSDIQELEQNRATPRGSNQLLHAILDLKCYKEHNVEFERMARDLTIEHLAHLFKARWFRKSLEKKDNKDLLDLIIGAVERGYPSQE